MNIELLKINIISINKLIKNGIYIFIFILIIKFLNNITIFKDKYYYSINNDKKQKNIKVSIFMPIYNKEQYLVESIKSIQNQTLKEIEIIAVNDASTDNSKKIIKKLAKIDNRIKIVNNDRNHGLLYSRAMGIINSSGDYIINLDPDDQFYSSGNLEFLYNQAKTFNLDTIKFDLLIKRNYKKKGRNIQRSLYELNKSNYREIMRDKVMTNKFIKRKVLIRCFNAFKNEIFRNKWNYHEDNIWSILIHRYSKSIKYIKENIYIYFQNKESLMHNRFNNLWMRNVIYRFEKVQKIFNYKSIDFLNFFIVQTTNYYKSIIKNDVEIRKKIINSLNIFIDKNTDNFYYNLIKNKISHIKKLMSNNKIIIINRLKETIPEHNILYLTIYNYINKYINKNILIINQNNTKEYNKIFKFINNTDFLIIYDEQLNSSLINCLNEKYPNNKILFFTGNYIILRKYNNFTNFTNNQKNNIKKTIIEDTNEYNQYYIKDYLFNISNYFNYEKYITTKNILIIFKGNLTNKYKIEMNKIISKHFSSNIIFIDHWPSKYLLDKKLINILTKYKIIITDDTNIMKISTIYYLSCILIEENNSLFYKDNNKNLDYIKYIKNINELESNLLKIKNKFINKELINNNFSYFLKSELTN